MPLNAKALLPSAVIMTLVAASAVHADGVKDPDSGLGVAPPQGYAASAASPRPPYSILYDVKRPDDRDTGCKVGYHAAPQNASFSQAELNDLASKPERKQVIEGTLGALYELDALDLVEHAGVKGYAASGTFKARPGMPERAQQIATVFYIMETPKGRTTIVCVAERDDVAARKPEFEALLHGTTMP
jgi:hypothetical protein